jgi:hypothetical protein
MSRQEPDAWEHAQLAFICPRCDASPGQWCRTKSGMVYPSLHSQRWKRVDDAFGPLIEYYENGLADLRGQLRELTRAMS